MSNRNSIESGKDEAQANPFVISPAATIEGTINMKSIAGRKIYQAATMKLSHVLYECTSDNLRGFLNILEIRASEYGWNKNFNGILHIPEDSTNPRDSPTKYLLNRYGLITLDTEVGKLLH